MRYSFKAHTYFFEIHHSPLTLLYLYLQIGWEFYGGQRRKHKHGLNRATSDAAPRTNGNLKFDLQQRENTDIIITNDEAPPAKHAVVTSSNSRWKDKEELLLLPDRYSVLEFDSHSRDGSFWGRLYVEGMHQYITFLFYRHAPNRVFMYTHNIRFISFPIDTRSSKSYSVPQRTLWI